MELSRSESPYLLNIYHANDPNEDAYDVLKLISILANERAKANGKDATVLYFKFGTDIWYVIFDPIKTFSYGHSVKKLRRAYNGIRTQICLQEKCREIFSSDGSGLLAFEERGSFDKAAAITA